MARLPQVDCCMGALQDYNEGCSHFFRGRTKARGTNQVTMESGVKSVTLRSLVSHQCLSLHEHLTGTSGGLLFQLVNFLGSLRLQQRIARQRSCSDDNLRNVIG